MNDCMDTVNIVDVVGRQYNLLFLDFMQLINFLNHRKCKYSIKVVSCEKFKRGEKFGTDPRLGRNPPKSLKAADGDSSDIGKGYLLEAVV